MKLIKFLIGGGYLLRILVDADACPVKDIIITAARERNIPVIMLMDTSHVWYDDYAQVITVDKERDGVDLALINLATEGDIVITQDYGVAALALGKGLKALNHYGIIFTPENMDKLLFERFLSQKVRRSGGKTRNTGKRTRNDDLRFEKALKEVLGQLATHNKVVHPFEPVYDENSKILILGTIPSIASRENLFFYGHPQNRFWKIISTLTKNPLPLTVKEKRDLLLKNNIALWDVLKCCEIDKSRDSSIMNPIPNDFTDILSRASIKAVFANGKKAHQLYTELCYTKTGIESIYLPSTSPANGRYNLSRLLSEWEIILTYIS
jgi:TDG/mug DNA glycosylase family protein